MVCDPVKQRDSEHLLVNAGAWFSSNSLLRYVGWVDLKYIDEIAGLRGRNFILLATGSLESLEVSLSRWKKQMTTYINTMVPLQVPNDSDTSRGNEGVYRRISSLALEELNTDPFDLAARLRRLLVLHSVTPLPPPSPLASGMATRLGHLAYLSVVQTL
jgi:hypothetical protein